MDERSPIILPGDMPEIDDKGLSLEESKKLDREESEEMEILRERIREEERQKLYEEMQETGGLVLGEGRLDGEEYTALGDCPIGLRGTVWEEVWRSGIEEFRIGFHFRGSTPQVYVNFTRKEGKDFSDHGKIDVPVDTILRRCAMKVRRIPPDTRLRRNHVPGADDDVDLGEIGKKAQEKGGWPQ